jgi:hypothetical protein
VNAAPLKPSPKQSILYQAHAFMECIVQLGEMERGQEESRNFLDKNVFSKSQTARALKAMPGSDISIFGGQGALLSFLYLFLVLPREWEKSEPLFKGQIDLSIAESTANRTTDVTKDTYKVKDGKSPVTKLNHLRNALAHGRITQEGSKIIFYDQRGNESCPEEEFQGSISLADLGIISQNLNVAIMEYFKKVQEGNLMV